MNILQRRFGREQLAAGELIRLYSIPIAVPGPASLRAVPVDAYQRMIQVVIRQSVDSFRLDGYRRDVLPGMESVPRTDTRPLLAIGVNKPGIGKDKHIRVPALADIKKPLPPSFRAHHNSTSTPAWGCWRRSRSASVPLF